MIREATPHDVPVILELVRELATYEREPDAVRASEADLHDALFGPEARVFALIAEHTAADGDAPPGVAGVALWFVNFSTWQGKHGVYLEDLFVRPSYRRFGHGRALLTRLAAIACDRRYARLEWAVLDWNTPAHDFYRSIGAQPMNAWTVWRVTGPTLSALAETSPDR